MGELVSQNSTKNLENTSTHPNQFLSEIRFIRKDDENWLSLIQVGSIDFGLSKSRTLETITPWSRENFQKVWWESSLAKNFSN
jgi:hypothetical protein